ncbi:MAG: adenosylmethionine--8-amino-7-oxononanoate transaminase [Polyangiales bacterium]
MIDLQRVLAADKAHVWHPYTPMDEWRARHDPLVVTRAEGPYFELADGSRLLDGNASWWVSTLGHNHPRLVRALKEQADKLCHVALAGITHEPAALLAKELAEVAPRGLDQVFYSDDGSTAIEAAVKMSLQFFAQSRAGSKKTRFVALDGAFHGETIGATSLGGVEVFRRPFASVVFECVHVPSPASEVDSCAPAWAEAFDAIADLLEREHDTIAGVVLEPIVQGAAGMRVYPPAYLRAVRDLCTKHDVLLIADEVFVGYGRLGKMWACDLAEIVPDLMCLAKGFTGGMMPMAATLTSQRIVDAFSGGRARAFLYGHSYSGNPLGAAIAREVLAVYRDESIVAGVAERAEMIASSLHALASPLVRDVRAIGAIGAVELREVPSSTRSVATVETTDDLGYAASIGWRVYDEARKRGAYLRPLGNVVYVCPALNIPLDDLSRLLTVMTESIEAAAR